jgi:histidinol-phosphate phosphatase family protein
MRRLHGRSWRDKAQTGPGRLPLHVATTASGLVALAAAPPAWLPAAGCATGARTRWLRRGAVVAAASWVLLTAAFAWRRIAPGPRTAPEVATMVWTSAAIPPVAVAHRLRGWWRHRHSTAWPPRPRAVLFDRDGTLVTDVPYNGDAERVEAMPGAAEAVERVRSAGLRTGVVSNQSGIARGLVSPAQVDDVNRAVDRLLGPFDTWQVCPHGDEDGCDCRKPRPGLVLAAARALGVRPHDCVVIGDIGSDVQAARAAGAKAVLVPTDVTRADEVADAALVAPDLPAAVELALRGWR